MERSGDHQSNLPDEAVSTSSASNLHYDIVVDILPRLPVKSFCRFKSLSKPWLSSLSSPEFSKNHVDLASQNKTRGQRLIFCARNILYSVDRKSITEYEPHTQIFPAEYKATHATDRALGAKGELRLYLDGLADADDVPTYVKEHQFGQPAVTAAHPDWAGTTSEVVNQLGETSEDDSH